ncbi:MAG: hypothetical protein D6732_07565, partial [Methanobacteriota archaeon]
NLTEPEFRKPWCSKPEIVTYVTIEVWEQVEFLFHHSTTLPLHPSPNPPSENEKFLGSHQKNYHN